MIADSLKKAVLQAAIQGKLTEQMPEDGDARDLLEEIKAEKERLVKEGKIKKEQPLQAIADDEIPFDIPHNWVFCKLGAVTDYGVGKQVNKSKIPPESWILELEDIEKESFKLIIKRFDRKPGSSKNRFLKGEVLYGKLRPYLKKVIVADESGYFTTEIVPFKSYGDFIVASFLQYFLVTPSTNNLINQITHGMNMPRLGTNKARNLILPLPPRAEQQRIVDKLDEILPEIDRLRDIEIKLDTLQKSFPTRMKSSILQAAIQGKLTQQLPEDGDAQDLLEEIKAEKERLIKEGKIKKEKPLPDITEDEISFDIPENWCWARLSDLGMIVGGGTPKTEDKRNWENGKIPWITPADMKNVNGKYVKNGERFITNHGLSHSSAQLMPKGSVLFSSRAPIGYLAIADNPICTNQGFKSVVPHMCSMSDFVYYYLMAFTQEIQRLGSGTTFKEVSGAVMKKLIIPLPPLSEQQRIVQRLDELLPLCDELF